MNHLLNGLARNMRTHVVVDAATGKYHFRMVANKFCLVRQIVWINTDAMPANKAWPEWQEVPLGSGRFEHFQRIEPQFVKYDGKLVNQRDIQIALGILDHLCSLG